MSKIASFFNPVPDIMTTPAVVSIVRSGTKVPVYEQSAIHSAARDALRPICAVNAFDDATADEWLASSKGIALRNLLRDFAVHGNTKTMET